MKARSWPASVGIYIAAMCLFLFVGFPIYWMVATSLTSQGQVVGGSLSLLPQPPTLENYAGLFGSVSNFGLFIINSVTMSLGTVLIASLCAIPAAYTFARYEFPWKKLLSRILLIMYFFPAVAIIIPLYVMFVKIGLADSLVGLALIYSALTAPFSTWLLTGFFKQVPEAITEAAMIDGASTFVVIVRIMLPLTYPSILAAAVYQFVTSWSGYIFPLVMINSHEHTTVPLGLAALLSLYSLNWGQVMAGAVLTALPVVVLFTLVSRWFVAGLVAGAVRE